MQVPAGTPALRGGAARLRNAAVVTAVVVAADQASKAWAVSELSDGPVEVFGSAVRFRLTGNTGGAFSLFAGNGALLAAVAVVLVVVLARMVARESDGWLVAGLSLVLGGALGNLADRAFRGDGFLDGAVVDFVDVGAWPTFNVADAAITIGVILVVVRGWRTEVPDEQAP
ncbi:MAG TPA: signal peptidase II [Acidimicrobiia bacterium]|nr:signal peptidase II [Acidimicrobiia bacterium]